MVFLQLQQPDADDIQAALETTTNKFAESTDQFIHMTWGQRWDALGDWALDTGWLVLKVVLVLLIGRWLIKRIDRLIDKVFTRRAVDTSVNTFIRSMLRIVGWLIVIMLIVSVAGIKTTSIAALIAAAGFAVGMALSGTLQNFAGGILILLLKPFRTGDYIQAQGYEGTVMEIKLFSTIIRTSDNKTVIVPNGGLSTSIINNFSASGTRRVEWVFSITYGDSYDKARETIKELLDAEQRILSSPPYFIALKDLTPSSVDIIVRAWTDSGDFWDVFFDMNEKIYKIFPQRGLDIPNNKIDVSVSMVDAGGKRSAANTTDSAAEIINMKNETKVSANSVASEDDSHEKLHGTAKDTPTGPKDSGQ